MPIQMAAISSVDTVIQTVWVDTDPDTIDFLTGPNQPVALIFDYHNWVLDVHTEVPSAVSEDVTAPTMFSLHPAYPNPFNSNTVIEFSVPVTCQTRLTVYNILGQKVTTLLDDIIDAGEHTIRWDGKSNLGNDVASGVYLIGMDAQSHHRVEKVVMLR